MKDTHTKPMIVIDQVVKKFGSFTALHGISAEIREGEFFSLLGPSGCGKTTLLRVIAGFEPPTKGKVAIGGKDMSGIPANSRPTNMVFQSYAIFPHLNVEENVGYGLKTRKMSKADIARDVAEVLKLVDMESYGKRKAHELSGGQRQRVALARALVMRPEVILLDEPLSALDKKLRDQMQVELRSLQRSIGITFILVTHDQEEALIMSDRIAVMFDGRIEQLDTPEGLYRRPVNRRVASFIGVMNFLPAKVLGVTDQHVKLDIAALGQIDVPRHDIDPAFDIEAVDTIGVRPEMFTLLADADDTAQMKVQGEVVDSEYYGDMTYYSVRLAGHDTPVTISMRNTAGRSVVPPGSQVTVGWGADSIVVFKE
ncbi:ABC transporter ATP-binding protein [Pseudosulfitobacter koreensis]|uniref:Spermidine/putrescine import ATP-binding protein PotA n=1 Tax=Pseudosulfitobacter koreensis TaxID=2968472 RepID=A0ABT1Z2Y4_9RHOB|nr:ABC transporter ATP-binding protein [Pseudosulfitobacter koreense]MCR8827495.1 ABC transporter ATP-binding protein [Pseudosulfitobacter koreense]